MGFKTTFRRGWVSQLLLGLVLVGTVRGEISSTNRPFAGITYYAETRTQPPTRMFVAEIDLTNPNVRLHVSPGGPDPDGTGPWQTTLMQPTRIAARDGFDLVVNGDFFRIKEAEGTNSTFRSARWSAVTGPAASNGRIWSTSASKRPCLVVRKDGKASIEMIGQPGTDAWEVVSGNTMLVEDGKIVPQQNKVRHPRTAVGLNADTTKLILLVVDGRKPGVAIGMNYDELAAEFIRLGCNDAVNLDGGGSSVMAVRDPARSSFTILNQPTDGRERAVANVLGISTRKPVSSETQPR
ncbi:MAG TPA: phosphodiester glycosidase family protein [Verrucomicrobiae bacterium]|nr:phosphodiester glycosidase family protein [Verrucomicrobiae bacterium]